MVMKNVDSLMGRESFLIANLEEFIGSSFMITSNKLPLKDLFDFESFSNNSSYVSQTF